MRSIRWLLLPFLLGSAPAFAGEGPHHATAARDAKAGKDDGAEKADGSRKRPALHGVVNLNTADDATLELLPGVGEKKATRILDYRHKHPFKKIEELTKVKGFGRKTLSHLKPYLTITGPSTLGADDGVAE